MAACKFLMFSLTSVEKSLAQTGLYFGRSLPSHNQSFNDFQNFFNPTTGADRILGIISWSNEGNRPQHDLQPSQQQSMHPKLQVQKIAITKIALKVIVTFHQTKIWLTKAEKSFYSNDSKNINTWAVEPINIIKVDPIVIFVAKYVAQFWFTILIKSLSMFAVIFRIAKDTVWFATIRSTATTTLAIHCFSYQLPVRIVSKSKSKCIAFTSTKSPVADTMNELDTWKTSEIYADDRNEAGHNALEMILVHNLWIIRNYH